MSDLDELRTRIERLEQELASQRRETIIEVKKLIEFHTHTLGGKVMWEFPPELQQKILEAMRESLRKTKPVSVKNEEKMTLKDDLKIIMTPGGVTEDGT